MPSAPLKGGDECIMKKLNNATIYGWEKRPVDIILMCE